MLCKAYCCHTKVNETNTLSLASLINLVKIQEYSLYSILFVKQNKQKQWYWREARRERTNQSGMAKV